MKYGFMIWILICLIFLTSCEQKANIDAPSDLTYQENMIMWSPIPKATSYTVLMDGLEFGVAQTFFDVSYLEPGDYQIMVRTNIRSNFSKYSIPLNITITPKISPSFLNIDGNVLRFEPIDGADGYQIRINNDIYHSTNHFFNLDFLDINQTYVIQVKSIYGTHSSLYSNPLHYYHYDFLLCIFEITYSKGSQDVIKVILNETFILHDLLYLDQAISKSNYQYINQQLTIYPNYLNTFDQTDIKIHILTSKGSSILHIHLIESQNPTLISNPTMDYEPGKDINIEFDLAGGIFISLSGHQITLSDYDIQDGILSISSAFIENVKQNHPDKNQLVFAYQIQKGGHIFIGYLFINI